MWFTLRLKQDEEVVEEEEEEVAGEEEVGFRHDLSVACPCESTCFGRLISLLVCSTPLCGCLPSSSVLDSRLNLRMRMQRLWWVLWIVRD